jgi:hypothetical protein
VPPKSPFHSATAAVINIILPNAQNTMEMLMDGGGGGGGGHVVVIAIILFLGFLFE